MDLCKVAVDSVLIGFGAAAAYVCVKAGFNKIANARRRTAERKAAHEKGEMYWQDVDWTKFAEDAGKLPQSHKPDSTKQTSSKLPACTPSC